MKVSVKKGHARGIMTSVVLAMKSMSLVTKKVILFALYKLTCMFISELNAAKQYIHTKMIYYADLFLARTNGQQQQLAMT